MSRALSARLWCGVVYMRVLAIIPAFNEEEALAATISGLTSTCPDVDYLVIDDGSSDGTSTVCKKNGFHCLRMPVNTGLSSVIRAGMKLALAGDYDAAIQFDADGQHLPQYIPEMAQALEEQEADVIIGSRVLAGESPVGLRGVGSRLISFLLRVTSHIEITDPTSGMRMFSRRMIEYLAHSFDVHPEPTMLAQVARKGWRIEEVPVSICERQGGESYLGFSSAIFYMMREVLSLLIFQWLR